MHFALNTQAAGTRITAGIAATSESLTNRFRGFRGRNKLLTL
jgi:hypothetical protein